MPFNWITANQSWFTFAIQAGEPAFDNLGVYAFSGVEKICSPYEFTVEVVSKDSNLDLTGMLGFDCLLTVADKSGGKRLIHSVIRQAEQLRTGNEYTLYRMRTVPRLWFLTQTQDQRIYQHQTVPQIIETVLDKHNFLGSSYAFKLRSTYQEREYVVQYGESDYHFIARLAQEEGIYWYHEHKENGHCLCFSDAEGGPSIPGTNSLRYHQGSGNPEDTAVISRLNFLHRVNSDSTTHREWNFTTPSTDLTGHERETEWEKAPVPIAMELETYKFPHLYQVKDEGDRYTNLQLLRQLTFRQWIECQSDVSRYMPGFTFSVYEHPRSDVNRAWWITEVRHEGKQPGVLEHESPDDRGLEYQSAVTAIPDDTRYVPEVLNKKVRIEGLQSAIVTGPAGEEVYVDKFGRVKVQFHWDRLGKHDETTTCWVRVADSWAGVNFGFIQIPRINQEVLVEFMEGDPDRPVITGRVYNTDLMPPWQLPEQKTLSGIQSREFRGAQRNQLLLDDTSGEVQAQLSSDHQLSQLNLGYLTRVNHVEGRKDFRGEGFELRTDGWGVIRAAKGLYVSTDARFSAEEHQKDVREAVKNLEAAGQQHKDHASLAEVHRARDHGEEVQPLNISLDRQNSEVNGNGKHGELAAPQMVMSSPAGIALTTPESTHIHTGQNVAITAERQMSVSAARGFMVTALKKISLFAHTLGIKMFAASGKVEIQAQSDDLDIIADRVLKIISAQDLIHISSPKEILLTAGGSYLKINAAGVESGTEGRFIVYASDHDYAGPRTKNPLPVTWSKGEPALSPRVLVRDELGRVVDVDRHAQSGTENIPSSATEHELKLFAAASLGGKVAEGIISERKELLVDGNKVKLDGSLATDADEV